MRLIGKSDSALAIDRGSNHPKTEKIDKRVYSSKIAGISYEKDKYAAESISNKVSCRWVASRNEREKNRDDVPRDLRIDQFDIAVNLGGSGLPTRKPTQEAEPCHQTHESEAYRHIADARRDNASADYETDRRVRPKEQDEPSSHRTRIEPAPSASDAVIHDLTFARTPDGPAAWLSRPATEPSGRERAGCLRSAC